MIPFNTMIPFKISWILDGFVDSGWIPRFTRDSWTHDVFLDSQWILDGFQTYQKLDKGTLTNVEYNNAPNITIYL